MTNFKKWSISVLAIVLLLLLFLSSVIIYIDPFFQYHKPLNSYAYDIYTETYQNPGIAKSFEYDSIVTGSSMTENFKPSWFKDMMGLKTIKVPYSGASTNNIKIILDLALEHNKNIKSVFMGLDIYALEKKANTTRNPLPEYLYDNNLFNDVNYLLNKAVLTDVIEIMEDTKAGKKTTSLDKAFSWHSKYRYSESRTLKSYQLSKRPSNKTYPIDHFIKGATDKLGQNILPIIEENPQVEFNIFFPPYSILFWYNRLMDNTIDATIHELDYAISNLLEYENVKVFYFQNIEDIVGNLYLYRDYTHYSEDVNYYIVKSIHNGNHLLTKQNYKQELEKMKRLAFDFNYKLFWGDIIPFKKETDINYYLELVRDPKYLVFMASNDWSIDGLSSYKKEYFISMGFDPIIFDNNAKTYVSVRRGDQFIFEDMGDQTIEYTNKIDELEVGLVSNIEQKDKKSQIILDGVEYSVNQKGLNIVVYDLDLNRVVDSVCFDLNLKEKAKR